MGSNPTPSARTGRTAPGCSPFSPVRRSRGLEGTGPRRDGRADEGDGLENRWAGQPVPWVRIPLPPRQRLVTSIETDPASISCPESTPPEPDGSLPRAGTAISAALQRSLKVRIPLPARERLFTSVESFSASTSCPESARFEPDGSRTRVGEELGSWAACALKVRIPLPPRERLFTSVESFSASTSCPESQPLDQIPRLSHRGWERREHPAGRPDRSGEGSGSQRAKMRPAAHWSPPLRPDIRPAASPHSVGETQSSSCSPLHR